MGIYQKVFSYLGIGLVVFLLARIGLLIVHFENFSTLSMSDYFLGFIAGMRFDLASIIVVLGIPFLLLSLPFQWAKNIWWHAALSLLVYFIILLEGSLLISDIVYFSYVKRHITNELLFLAQDVEYILKEISANTGFFLVWMGLLGLSLFFWLKLIRVPLKPVKFQWVKFIILFFFIGIAGRGGVGWKPLSIVDAFAYGNSELGNLVLNGVFSASHSSLLSKSLQRTSMSKEETVEILNLEKEFWKKPYPLSKNIQDTISERPNIMVLFVESLTPKYVDSFGGNQFGITPNLDQLSKQGWKFNNFFSHGQRSIEGAQSVLTGLPSIPGMPSIISLSAKYSKIAQLAEDNGISSIFVNSTIGEAFSADSIAGAVGFPEYYSKEDMPLLLDYPEKYKDRDLGWDYETLMFTMDKLETIKTPFLAFSSLSTDHTPFPQLMAPFNQQEHGENIEGGYINSLHYTDWSIGEFFKAAQNKPWFENTIFIITADHALAHFQSGDFLERFRIPLIFYAPKLLEPRVIENVTSQLDLFPTLIEMQNMQGNYTALGTSLYQKKESLAMIREGSLIGIITDKGYLKHSLVQRLESKNLQPNISAAYFDQLEAKLLAWDRVAFDLVSENRWAQ